MKINKLIYLVCAAFMMNTSGLFAQSMQTKDDDLHTSLMVENDIKPKISDAVKIDVVPEKEAVSREKKEELAYKAPGTAFKVNPEKKKLASMSIKNNADLDELKHVYLSAGFGNYSNFYTEAYINNTYNKNNLLSGHVKYLTGNAQPKNSGFSDFMIDASGKKMFDKFVLKGSVGYIGNTLHFYGYDHAKYKDRTADSVYQSFSDFNFSGRFENSKADTGALLFSLGADYYNFGDHFKSQENVITLSGKAIKPFNSDFIVFEASYDYLDFKATKNYSRNILKIDAGYKFNWETFRGIVGFKTANESDTGSSFFHFYPNVKAETDVLEKTLVAFGELSGDLQRNTFKSLARENPFILSDPSLTNTNNKLTFLAGAKGIFNNSFYYMANASYGIYKNMYFFVNDSANTSRFVPLYATENTGLLKLHVEGGAQISEAFKLNLGLNLNNYNITTPGILQPYHKPGYDLYIKGRYNLENKIVFGMEIFSYGKRYSRIGNSGNPITLKGGVDMNLNALYHFNDLLGISVDFKNILNTQYNIWNNYPVRGFQVLAGLRLSFL